MANEGGQDPGDRQEEVAHRAREHRGLPDLDLYTYVCVPYKSLSRPFLRCRLLHFSIIHITDLVRDVMKQQKREDDHQVSVHDAGLPPAHGLLEDGGTAELALPDHIGIQGHDGGQDADEQKRGP